MSLTKGKGAALLDAPHDLREARRHCGGVEGVAVAPRSRGFLPLGPPGNPRGVDAPSLPVPGTALAAATGSGAGACGQALGRPAAAQDREVVPGGSKATAGPKALELLQESPYLGKQAPATILIEDADPLALSVTATDDISEF